ncbi:multidrug efflux transporter AcrB transmembrane domain-containing protein [Punctularia strigosozonata HHB-11173 SS5]|uniref:multidrug efflux transporter AcrB transmembrane domain-containing protein n=1 Tax=Punctularia strigosozonata (strain HHB-11173) TaxID=741275 RepID=UPI000441817A|nr:multidrug efflux transporter AcrB transmembrane domain-containing protein [Punctularia strigosozonata HHB-11173 SS5]EIN10276.1 multidrug efflux transporter AcrB transmembrane domain-containing protein [Punctularia strigosozonata HHB-11173 SS5]
MESPEWMPSVGQCAMRGSCGSKGWFGKPLPCPYDGPPSEPEDSDTLELLTSVCGADLAQGPVCCTSDQLETLRDNLQQVEPIISSCPACRNNFRSFFCHFTCSPTQASFVNITATQKTRTGQTAVKELDFYASQRFSEGFFDSCKNVQVGSANSWAMDLIGGGAKDYKGFLKFLGDEKDLGSPFQINYPSYTPPPFAAFNATPRNCADNDLSSRCTCIDCPDVCLPLPDVPAPGSEPTCHVGTISCLTFVLTLGYALAVAAFFATYVLQLTIRRRREKAYDGIGITLAQDQGSSIDTPLSPRAHVRHLVGASSLAQASGVDGDDSVATARSESRHLGRGASLLDPLETVQPRQHRLNTFLRRSFYRLGLSCASYPWLTFAMIFAIVGLLNVGWKDFSVETDPVRLWVAPNSESRIQKEYFDEHFGPFYRTEQMFVTATSNIASDGTTAKPPVLSWDHLKYWANIESDIRALHSHPHNYTLDDVCFKPTDTACVVQSVLAWFDNDLSMYDEDTWKEQLLKCANSPVDCLPEFGQPLAPQYVLGKVPGKEGADGKDYLGAEAMVINYVVSDSLDPEVQARAMEWETTLREYMESVPAKAREEAGLEIAWTTGVSLEEEISKSSNTDVRIVVLSYVAMFFYVAFTLGANSSGQKEDGVWASLNRWARGLPKLFRGSSVATSSTDDDGYPPTLLPRLPRSLFVNSKFTLGLFGIVLVVLSVSSSVGFFSLAGVKTTLIIAEVIPFLVLAVGVDNVFILVHELDRQNLLHGPNASALAGADDAPVPGSPTMSLSPTQPFAGFGGRRMVVDPSTDDAIDAQSTPLFLSPEERVARALAKMGPSILLSTITETVAFALGALVPMPAVRNFALYAAGSVMLNAFLQVTVFVSALVLDLRRVEASRVDCLPCIRLPPRIALLDAPPSGSGLGRIGKFIRRHYAPFLLKPIVKGSVLLSFAGVFVLSVISIQHLQLGLDQRLALPSDSYLVPYFDNLEAYLDIGPPVYFVSYDTNVTARPGQQKLCGRFTTCNDFSIANVLEAERKRPSSSFISEPTASWIDDFLNWLNPLNEECCRVRIRDPSQFCGERDSPRLCRPCFKGRTPAWNITMDGFPEDGEFMHYLKQWLVSPTNADCPLAGKASFGAALSLSEDDDFVEASHFRTFHSPLRSQEDFINSFAAAHRIADELSEKSGTKVFPYSLHYVFFDQYAHIVAITQEILGLGLAGVLLVTALLLGSWRTGSIVTGVVGLTVTSVMGVMGVWGISLNAISLVNLVISLGIAVEFCAHIARAFMSAGSGLPVDHPAGQKERDERMWTALVDVGPSVLSGITFTKLIGMCVLALTRSKLLEIYYFRMWLTLIISGALHGLVLLPVILSLAGGPGFSMQEADEEWMSNAIRNDYEYTPFLADDDSTASD